MLLNRIMIGSGLVLFVTALPVTARAQAASGIAGVVRDTSGAVIPGVTVEAASPALIEKVRTVVTDAQGLYRIVDLLPGAYTVTFSLDVVVHGDGQWRAARRRTAGDHHRDRAIAGRRHTEYRSAESHLARAARVGSQQPFQFRGADPRRLQVDRRRRQQWHRLGIHFHHPRRAWGRHAPVD
ncbi:MAG: hypothetical protein DMF89_18875 [Acidobacteria bacterium]|nr:MAG: hypothetical protein DMF89_18875 [Acidobacteriota bacterium]